ncbi:hypothetical protein SERLADRAFT_370017 [Serpula lacrymans var. lacrymans S7.9]|uniref:Uncharacterized protein n=1 Tax=Serpula lacrymans var. lacrymans (strain S7.9) TaxID=578457 RepID=F8NXV8_SERL9|nr:uncharacterized protein SERLADRAFT_370017 [Serpula lacrymans var. lacrymans S7.9]EGO24774.1 hypothetical protein SERLADRAFT_370017 [Serpula lacrymans var. lacrymans S7.9]
MGSNSSTKVENFKVSGLHYCSLVEIIKEVFCGPLAKKFHLFPFKHYFKASDRAPEERVFNEVYTSDAWLHAHDALQKQPPKPGCKLERVIAGLMFWSDSTHLANFGTAKSSIIMHCRRKLFHAVWQLFLDDEFLHAYNCGIVLKCSDGVQRRVYPCLFTYSVDYPEKDLIATIRDMGNCPCPRCLVPKSEIDKIGQVRDLQSRVAKTRSYAMHKIKLAREVIYCIGHSITSSTVDDILKNESWVPTVNAFVNRLRDNFDVFPLLVVDLMHEIELGVWKSTFTHLVCILYASTWMQDSGKYLLLASQPFAASQITPVK